VAAEEGVVTKRRLMSKSNQVPREEAEAILLTAGLGGEVSREAVREVLDSYQAGERATDPAEEAESRMISSAAGGNLLRQETLRSRLAWMRKSLAQEGDGELEHLLIHRVVLAWLALVTGEQVRAQKWQTGVTTADADFWDRHVSRLHTEFLRASKTLAQVRKLNRATVVNQLNIAEQQQINVMGQDPSATENEA